MIIMDNPMVLDNKKTRHFSMQYMIRREHVHVKELFVIKYLNLQSNCFSTMKCFSIDAIKLILYQIAFCSFLNMINVPSDFMYFTPKVLYLLCGHHCKKRRKSMPNNITGSRKLRERLFAPQNQLRIC